MGNFGKVAAAVFILGCVAADSAAAQTLDQEFYRTGRDWLWRDPNGPLQQYGPRLLPMPAQRPIQQGRGVTAFAPLNCNTVVCTRTSPPGSVRVPTTKYELRRWLRNEEE